MASPETEADARIVIDDGLRAAGWDPADKSQVRTEVHISEFGSSGIRQAGAGYRSESPGEDVALGSGLSGGRADYVLYDQSGRPLAVIEAKKNAIHPYAMLGPGENELVLDPARGTDGFLIGIATPIAEFRDG